MPFDPQTYTDFGAALTALEARIGDEFTAQAAAIAALPAPREIRTVRVAGPALAASSTTDVAVTWPTAFADASYNAHVELQESLSSVSNGVVVRQIRSKTATGITVRVSTGTQAFAAGDFTVIATGIHD